MKNNEINKAQKAMRTIAKEEGVSVDNVRREIKTAIAEGLSSSDAAVKAMWENVPCKGDVPEPEELIAWLAEVVRERMKN